MRSPRAPGPARSDPTAWAKKSGVEIARRVDADREPGYVDPLADHPHRHHPPVVGVGERRDLLRRRLLVGEHHGRRLTADLLQQRGVRAGGVLVGGDHQTARVGDVPAYLGQPAVGGRQHRRHPLPRRVERRAQRLRAEVLGHRLAEPRGHLVARAGAPGEVAGVGHEEHRAYDVVGERVPVAVGEVGDRARDPVGAGRVGDERDRVDVGAERRTGQRQPPRRRLERLADRLAPRQRVTRVVHLVEDHQRLEALGPDPHGQRVHRDAGVGHRDARRSRPTSRPDPAEYVGSSGTPALAAASAHCSLRCSVGATTMIRSTIRRPRSSAAADSAKVVLPAPGVATAR